MQTINTQLKLIEYLGENPLNISNLPGLLNLKKLGTFFSNSVITWVQGDPPMFQGFSSLLRESGYYVLSQGSLPYTLHNETEIIPSPKNVVSTLQIVSWKCNTKPISEMNQSFFNGVSKIGKLNNNSFTTWQPGIPDMFQGFLSFEKDETYLILSNPSGLPYQLYQCAGVCGTRVITDETLIDLLNNSSNVRYQYNSFDVQLDVTLPWSASTVYNMSNESGGELGASRPYVYLKLSWDNVSNILTYTSYDESLLASIVLIPIGKTTADCEAIFNGATSADLENPLGGTTLYINGMPYLCGQYCILPYSISATTVSLTFF
jgi:hypothetical protein